MDSFNSSVAYENKSQSPRHLLFDDFEQLIHLKSTSRVHISNLPEVPQILCLTDRIAIEESHLCKLMNDYCKLVKSKENSYFENMLENIIKQQKGIDCITLSDFHQLYPMYRLEREEIPLNDAQGQLVLQAGKVLNTKAANTIKFKCFMEIIFVISALIVRWGLFKKQRYEHRIKGISKLQNFINATDLNSTCVCHEVLWMCLAIREKPFKELLTIELLQHSQLLEAQINSLVESLITPEPYSLKNKGVVFDTNNFEKKKTKSLRMNSCWKFLQIFKRFENKTYNILVGFEIAYRVFEKNLLGFLYSISNSVE